MGAKPGTLSYSTGFNLPFSGDQLLQDFGFINLKNGNTQITAVKNDFAGNSGGANSIKASGGVQLFNSGQVNPASTISFQGAGSKFFSTPTADSSQSVAVTTQGGAGKLTVKQNATSSNQSLSNKLGALTTTQWVLLAGGIGAAILVFTLVRR